MKTILVLVSLIYLFSVANGLKLEYLCGSDTWQAGERILVNDGERWALVNSFHKLRFAYTLPKIKEFYIDDKFDLGDLDPKIKKKLLFIRSDFNKLVLDLYSEEFMHSLRHRIFDKNQRVGILIEYLAKTVAKKEDDQKLIDNVSEKFNAVFEKILPLLEALATMVNQYLPRDFLEEDVLIESLEKIDIDEDKVIPILGSGFLENYYNKRIVQFDGFSVQKKSKIFFHPDTTVIIMYFIYLPFDFKAYTKLEVDGYFNSPTGKTRCVDPKTLPMFFQKKEKINE